MSDYNFLMESRLSPEQFQVVRHVSRVAVEQGLNLYLVGGAVRDLTYGQQTVRDLDFVTEGNPQRIVRHLGGGEAEAPRTAAPGAPAGEQVTFKVESTRLNQRLNSAEIQFSNGVRIEIAMSRHEAYLKPGYPPEVSPAMIFEDLKRRDLSMNAIAVSLHPNSRGLLLDPTNGAADIEKHESRALHSRSFSDDPSRIYRLLRLDLRLGFKPEERTKGYLQAALEHKYWERMEPEQQGRELKAILQEESPGRVFKILGEQRLLAGLDKKVAHGKIPLDRFAKIRAVAQTVQGADPYLLNFFCLVQNLPAAQRSRLAKKIIGDSKSVSTALGMERAARKLAQALSSSKNALPSRVYKLLSGQPKNLLLFLLIYHPQTTVQNRVKSYLHKFPLIRARLPRAEFQAMGMKPGPKFEQILEQIFFEQLDGKINTHPQMIKRLRALSGIKEPPPPPRPKPVKAAKAPKGAPKVPKAPEKPPEPPKPAKPGKAAKSAKPAASAHPARKAAKPAKHAAPAKRVIAKHKKKKKEKIKKKKKARS